VNDIIFLWALKVCCVQAAANLKFNNICRHRGGGFRGGGLCQAVSS
jgi:hypothetical protein